MLYFYINDPLFVFRSAFRLSCEKKKKIYKTENRRAKRSPKLKIAV